MDMIVLRRFLGRVGRLLLMGESVGGGLEEAGARGEGPEEAGARGEGLEKAGVNEWGSTKGPERRGESLVET
jgi:hypothetical protein